MSPLDGISFILCHIQLPGSQQELSKCIGLQTLEGEGVQGGTRQVGTRPALLPMPPEPRLSQELERGDWLP